MNLFDLNDSIDLFNSIDRLIKERLKKKNISEAQEAVLIILTNKSASHISHLLKPLEESRIVKRVKRGKNVYVYPVFDVIVAYKDMK